MKIINKKEIQYLKTSKLFHIFLVVYILFIISINHFIVNDISHYIFECNKNGVISQCKIINCEIGEEYYKNLNEQKIKKYWNMTENGINKYK